MEYIANLQQNQANSSEIPVEPTLEAGHGQPASEATLDVDQVTDEQESEQESTQPTQSTTPSSGTPATEVITAEPASTSSDISTEVLEAENQATCTTTCNLKCKTEAPEAVDPCVRLCFNQCTASIHLQESSTTQTHSAHNLLSLYETEAESNGLEPDEFTMQRLRALLMSSETCSTSCVSQCGRLAILPNGTPEQLTACFSDTCKCPNKYDGALDSQYNTIQLGDQYFSMVHNHERVDYLMIEQNSIRDLATRIVDNGEFLKDNQIGLDHKYLGSARNSKNQESQISYLTIATSLTIIFAVGFLLKFAYKLTYTNSRNETKNNVKFDCEAAILKKYKLET